MRRGDANTQAEATSTFYNTPKGFGFIRAANGSGDMYFHATGLIEYPSPQRGDVVEFVVIDKGDGRSKAVDIKLVERWLEAPK